MDSPSTKEKLLLSGNAAFISFNTSRKQILSRCSSSKMWVGEDLCSYFNHSTFFFFFYTELKQIEFPSTEEKSHLFGITSRVEWDVFYSQSQVANLAGEHPPQWPFPVGRAGQKRQKNIRYVSYELKCSQIAYFQGILSQAGILKDAISPFPKLNNFSVAQHHSNKTLVFYSSLPEVPYFYFVGVSKLHQFTKDQFLAAIVKSDVTCTHTHTMGFSLACASYSQIRNLQSESQSSLRQGTGLINAGYLSNSPILPRPRLLPSTLLPGSQV